MLKAYTVEDGVIVINRELTELDSFVKHFIDILKKHTQYLIVSGFVSIATGRTRGTEDVDVLVPVMDSTEFTDVFNELLENDFWCYQGDTAEEAYRYVKNMSSIRFARVNEMFPNMEVVPVNETKRAKFFELNHPQKMRVRDFEFSVPPIEFEILYKEMLLGGEKDIADARHLRTLFAELVQEEKFKKYKAIIGAELR